MLQMQTRSRLTKDRWSGQLSYPNQTSRTPQLTRTAPQSAWTLSLRSFSMPEEGGSSWSSRPCRHHLALLFALLRAGISNGDGSRASDSRLVKPMDFSRTHVTPRPERARHRQDGIKVQGNRAPTSVLQQTFPRSMPMGSMRKIEWDPICMRERVHLNCFHTLHNSQYYSQH